MDGEKYNIYRIDDVLIKAGYVFLVLFILTGGTAISNMVKQVSAGGPDSLAAAAALLLAPSAVFLLVGYRFRKKEQVAASILRAMERAQEAPVPDLMAGGGYSRRMVEQALLLINRRGLGYYVLDGGSDRIVDGRLRRNMVLVERCDRCGGGMAKSVPASQEEPPKCPYCGAPIGMDRWNKMRGAVLEDIRRRDAPAIQPRDTVRYPAPSVSGRTPFSLPVFILLLFIFWPAAIAYAVSRYNRAA